MSFFIEPNKIKSIFFFIIKEFLIKPNKDLNIVGNCQKNKNKKLIR